MVVLKPLAVVEGYKVGQVMTHLTGLWLFKSCHNSTGIFTLVNFLNREFWSFTKTTFTISSCPSY